MKLPSPTVWLACAATAAALAFAPTMPAQAQQSASWRTAAPYTQQELDQMLAPIALYPDALLAQVLRAATYPLEVVQAARFVQRNAGLSGDSLARAVDSMRWDPSVAALTQFPSVLAMMSEELEWTERLGEAFLAQPEQVMDTVQELRAKAYAAGSLRSTDRQQVIVQERVIVIEPWRPGLLWVPFYNPLIVFGTWWWPAYPPFLWVPPVAYRPPYFPEVYSVGIVWGPVVIVLSSLWDDPRPVWRDRYVTIDNTRYTNVIVTNATAPRPLVWRHDPTHRRSVEYRSPVVRDRYRPSLPARPAPADRVAPAPRERVTPAPTPRERERVTPAPAQRERMTPTPAQRERVTPTQRERVSPGPAQREPATPRPTPRERVTPTPAPQTRPAPQPQSQRQVQPQVQRQVQPQIQRPMQPQTPSQPRQQQREPQPQRGPQQ